MSAGNIDPKLIESIPTAILKTLPAGEPPPGTQPDFVNPPTQVPVILGVSIAFVVLAVFCFSLRIYTKFALTKNWKWDDLTCSLGFMCGIVYFVAVVNGCINGGTGRHIWDIHLDKALNKSSLYQDYITTILATPALGLIKSSLFIQYYLLFRPLRWIRITFVLNSPWPGESFLDDILSWHYLKFAQFSIPTGVIGMLVDLYLFILPIPAVLTLQMSTVKKLGVLIIFMTGGLAAIASIVNLYYRVQLQGKFGDPSWNVGHVLIWTQIEMFAGVTASSMPTVKQFFTRQDFSLMSWTSSVKSSLTHLLSSSARDRLDDDNPNSTNWGESKTHTLEDHEAFRMRDLKSGSCERKTVKAHRTGDSQIYLTTDISVT